MTESQNFSALALQLFAGAASATDPAERTALEDLAKSYEAKAVEARIEEAAKDRADREFWAQRKPMNWVS